MTNKAVLSGVFTLFVLAALTGCGGGGPVAARKLSVARDRLQEMLALIDDIRTG